GSTASNEFKLGNPRLARIFLCFKLIFKTCVTSPPGVLAAAITFFEESHFSLSADRFTSTIPSFHGRYLLPFSRISLQWSRMLARDGSKWELSADFSSMRNGEVTLSRQITKADCGMYSCRCPSR